MVRLCHPSVPLKADKRNGAGWDKIKNYRLRGAIYQFKGIPGIIQKGRDRRRTFGRGPAIKDLLVVQDNLFQVRVADLGAKELGVKLMGPGVTLDVSTLGLQSEKIWRGPVVPGGVVPATYVFRPELGHHLVEDLLFAFSDLMESGVALTEAEAKMARRFSSFGDRIRIWKLR